jgi:hypothetical protein
LEIEVVVGRQPAKEHTHNREREIFTFMIFSVCVGPLLYPSRSFLLSLFLLHGKKRREKKGKKMKRISETSLCGRELKSECSAPEALNPDVISPSHVIAVE